MPNAAVTYGLPRMGARLPFDLALDGSGTLLIAWASESGLGAAWVGQGCSPTALVATGASDVLLATNAGGTAFAAWRDAQRVMAARSPQR